METCSKKYIDSSFGYSVFKPVKVQCQNQVYKAGLCAHHYRRSIEKQTLWSNRTGYVDATQEDLDRGRSLKLKDTAHHFLFRFRKGNIEVNKKNVWVVSDMQPDFNLFCVKK